MNATPIHKALFTALTSGRKCFWVLALLVIVMSAQWCGAIGPAGETFDAPRLSAPPTIDGDISDPVWSEAKKLDCPWYRSDIDAEATARTVVWIGCDDTSLYVAFHAYGDPSKLKADVVRRDASLTNDDWVAVDLDPYLDRRTIYWFDVNPRGTQYDRIPSGTTSKVEWKGDWYAGAKIVDDGWTAEIAIPFSILAYRPNTTQFGIDFMCHSSANLETSRWANVGRMQDLTRMGVISGLALPSSPTPRPTILAYVLGSDGEDEKVGLRGGLDMKLAPRTNTTALLTVNPDFGNVEQSVDSIDFSYTQRALPDARPFFAEGSSYFGVSNGRYSLFNSRQGIGQIDTGIKYFGKTGRWTTAFLDTWRHDQRNDFVGRVLYDIGSFSQAGLFASRVTGEGPRNDVIAGDLTLGKAEGGIGYSYVDSAYGGDEHTHRSAQRATATLDSAHWYVAGSFTDIQKGFDLRDGIVYDDDIRGPAVMIDWFNDQATGKIMFSDVSVNWAEMHDHEGNLRFIERSANAYFEFRRDIICSFWQSWYTRPPYDDNYRGVYLGIGQREAGRGVVMFYSWGRRAGERYSLLNPILHFHPMEPLYLTFSQERMRLGEMRETQTIATITYELSSEKSLSGRWIGRNGCSNISLAYRQAVRRGMDIYIIYGEPNADDTVNRLTVKILMPL